MSTPDPWAHVEMLPVLLLLGWILTSSQTTWALPAPQSKLWWQCQDRRALSPGVQDRGSPLSKQETLKDEESPQLLSLEPDPGAHFPPGHPTTVRLPSVSIFSRAVQSKLGTQRGGAVGLQCTPVRKAKQSSCDTDIQWSITQS